MGCGKMQRSLDLSAHEDNQLEMKLREMAFEAISLFFMYL